MSKIIIQILVSAQLIFSSAAFANTASCIRSFDELNANPHFTKTVHDLASLIIEVRNTPVEGAPFEIFRKTLVKKLTEFEFALNAAGLSAEDQGRVQILLNQQIKILSLEKLEKEESEIAAEGRQRSTESSIMRLDTIYRLEDSILAEIKKYDQVMEHREEYQTTASLKAFNDLLVAQKTMINYYVNKRLELEIGEAIPTFTGGHDYTHLKAQLEQNLRARAVE